MYVMIELFVLASVLGSYEAKTVSGTLSSKNARLHWGQVIGDFMYSGQPHGAIVFEIKAGSPFERKFHLYREAEFNVEDEADTCQTKLQRAALSFGVDKSGNRTIPSSAGPDTWYVVYSDKLTCRTDTLTPDKPRIDEERERDALTQYEVHFFNPDRFGYPTYHFSAEEFGLLRFYQFLTLAYFVFGCIFAPKLVQILGNRGPMYEVLCVLSAAVGVHGMSTLFMLFHLYRYSTDGMGSRFMQDCAELLDMGCQLLMLYMLISVSLGWTLSGHEKQTVDSLKTKPASKIVGALAISQFVLFIWEQTQDLDHRLHHPPTSVAGTSLLVLRVALAVMFAGNLILVIKFERSQKKKDFHNFFARVCVAWFISYPLLLMFSWCFSEYYSYKFLTYSVVLCRISILLALYRLFLARSLFWEVSSLSTYLRPLKQDKVKSLSIKIHS